MAAVTKDIYDPITAASAVNNNIIVPSDTVANEYDRIYVGVTGNINCVLRDGALGSPVLYENVPVGYFHIATKYIFSTSTTATKMVGEQVGRGKLSS